MANWILHRARLVDEEAAEVVRRIFSLTLEGYGPYQIACKLSADRIEIPVVHLARFNEGVNRSKPIKDPYGWGSSTIVNILKKREYFQDTYDRATRYIPNGVNPVAPAAPDIIREKYGLEKDSYILYLGRMVPEKGCHYLVDAFKKLHTDKKLVIAGGSSDTHWYIDQLKEQAGGDDRIIFTGFVDGALREELYSNAYLFVLPSDLEGMPLCLLEAMSYGNCVITSDIEECYNVIHDNGIVFRKGDVDDLAQKLTYALEHPNAVRMFKWLAAEYVCTRFPWDKIVVETLKLYQK